MRCCLLKDHGSDHDLRPAHRLLWERFYGTPPPARNAALRPKNGDWLDLRMANWHIVSRVKIKGKASEADTKTCIECEEKLPLSAFYPKRRACKSCYSGNTSKTVKKRNNHVVENACVIREKRHYHLTDPVQARELMYLEFFDRLHAEHPHPAGYKLAYRHYRSLMRRLVESGSKENPDAKPD